MAIAFTTLGTPLASTTNATSYVTASQSPTANRLLKAAVLLSRGSSTDPVTPTLSGNGLTWALVNDGVTSGNQPFPASGTLRYRLCLFEALTGGSPSAGALTVTCGGITHTGCAVIVAQSNDEVDLADAVVQVDTVSPGFVTSAAAALAAFADANNAAFSCWALDTTAAITHEGTELADVTYSTPAARLQAQYLATEDTTPGVSWSGSANVGGIAVEVRIEAAGGAFELDAQPGTFAVTGAAASPLAGRTLPADPGSLNVTGAAADVPAGRVVSALPGAYTLTGSAAGTLADRLLNAAAGSYTVTGLEADLVYQPTAGAFELNAETGSYTVAGVAASPIATRLFTASPGSFTVTGSDAAVPAGRALLAAAGSYTLTGATTGHLTTRILVAATGAYTVAGADAVLEAVITSALVLTHFDQPTPSGGADPGNPSGLHYAHASPGGSHYDQPDPFTVLA